MRLPLFVFPVAGAIGGAMIANNIYETRRHDYGIHSDCDAKMSFPIVNCQAGGDMFVSNLEGLPTVVPVEKYVQPGEESAKPDEHKDEAKCDPKTTQSDLHRLNLDDPNGDWCKCKPPGCFERIGYDSHGKVQGFITVQCVKCGKISVEFARKALSLEGQAKSQDVGTKWTGNRSDAVKAAHGK